MAQFTKKAILDTFQEILEDTPFDKITVSMLVKKCGISPNTFYYHYHDIYDLLDAWLHRILQKYTVEYFSNGDWSMVVRAFLRDCQTHTNIFDHIYLSLTHERLERYVFSMTDDAITLYVKMRAAGSRVTEDRLHRIINFCRYASLGFFMEFIWNRMSYDVDAMVDDFAILFDGFVDQALKSFSEE